MIREGRGGRRKGDGEGCQEQGVGARAAEMAKSPLRTGGLIPRLRWSLPFRKSPPSPQAIGKACHKHRRLTEGRRGGGFLNRGKRLVC